MKKSVALVIACIIMAVGTILIFKFTSVKKVENYDVLYESSARMQRALDEVKNYCLREKISLDPEDVNRTFLIGPEITELTSTVGNPEVKRTTINPNNAAVMASYFLEAGLKEGGAIGVGCSGSFPAYAIAAVCAATELGLKTKVIASYGSSMYGATRPELNIVTILNILKDAGIADFDLVAVSPGGSNDKGVGAFEEVVFDNTRSLVLELAGKSNTVVIDETDMEKNVKVRLDLLGDIDCFVNIGGATANNGSEYEYFEMEPGVVKHLNIMPKAKGRGLVFEYLDNKVPVINILNIKKIASDNGMPIDPLPLPNVGDGGVYYETTYPVAIIVLTLLSTLAICCFWKYSKKR